MNKPHALANAVQLTHPNGITTVIAAADLEAGTLVKLVSGKAAKCTAVTDPAIGVTLDAVKSGDIVPVAILGCATGTVGVLAAGAVTAGDQITATGAKTTAAGDVIVGRALSAATAAGDLIELAHCVAAVK